MAFQFLTIVPLRGAVQPTSEAEMAGSTVFFPLVGVAQGILLGAVAGLLSRLFPLDIVALFTVLVHIVISGGFHIDGLSDTFDALSVKPSGDIQSDIEKRLSVMKDPSVGAIGALSVVLLVLLKFLFIKVILTDLNFVSAVGILVIMPLLSKWTMMTFMKNGRPARKDGLGRVFIGKTNGLQAFMVTLGVAIASNIVSYVTDIPFALPILLMVVLYVFGLGFLWMCERNFNGITGDNIGAVAEMSEVVFLTGAYIWLR